MDEEEKLLEKIAAQTQKLIDASFKGTITEKKLNDQIEKVNKEIAKLTSEEVDKLKKILDEQAAANNKLEKQIQDQQEVINVQGGEIKKLSEKGVREMGERQLKFKDALKECLLNADPKLGILQDINDDFGPRKSLKKFIENGGRASLTMKSPVDMFESNIFADAATTQYALAELVGPRVSIPLAVYPHVTQVFSVKAIKKPYMALMVAYGYEDGADTKPEGTASVQSSLLLKAVSFKAFYIATHFVFSDETLDDLDEVVSEVGAIGPDKLLSKLDSKVLGTAGDDSTDIKGIRTTGATGKSTAYDTATVSDIDGATMPDVFLAMKLQAENNGYKPNVVLINPADEFRLGANKNTLTDSRQDRRVSYDAQGRPSFIGGLRIIANGGMTANQAIVFDNTLTWLGVRRDLTVEIGYNGTDLVEGQKTMVIKMRVAFGVRDKAGVIWSNNVDNAVAQMEAS